MTLRKNIKKILKVILFIFAFIGIIFTFVFIAIQFGWLNVKGSISERNSYFKVNKNELGASTGLNNIFNNQENYIWANTDEWRLMKEVFIRDQEMIRKAANDAQVSPRIIISCVMGEQFRFFNNRRDSFKSYFEPLKILASLSKISYGIAGLKPKTVGQIEEHLKDPYSPYYLGKDMENLLDYNNENIDIEAERMNRITDVKNPYYPYLYVGLYIKQIIAQWERAGFDISSKPDILATLYNLGFYYSIPKENPQSGGAVINIGGMDYVFGDIAYEFYFSSELSDIFPLEVQ